ncbi:protein SCAR2-like isoform X2 [Papaver somniferum]|nr:protein SCAR2-like isoform X2 [Papaver somniferum]
MTTSARGHGLMTRLQQIEADVPLVERGLLSQTSFSQFLHNGGVDWHTNFRMDQNQITRGDLPRFIMDSYEECRGPPRLFLLDKFDTAGAGACLKRYSDPSFYKSSSETILTEGQSEKRARKFKRKSAYRKYGETPGSTPTSHPKLHELLSEDKIQTQNGRPPIHHVRLKRRPSSSSVLNSPTGKSYMEKYLVSVSPLSKPPYESPLRLEMEPSNSSELIQEIHEVHVSSSPVNKSRKREISSVPSPSKQGMVREQSLDDLNVNIVEKEVLKLSESTPDIKLENTPSTLGMAEDQNELVGDDEDRKIDASSDGYRSDDINEAENYVDASPAMEPEAKTGIGARSKSDDINVFMDEKKGGDSNTHEESEKLEAQCSASMSAGNSYPSDDDNNSFIEGRFSVSYSSPPSNLTKNAPVNGDGAAEVHSFTDRVVDRGTYTQVLGDRNSDNSFDASTSYILDHDTDKKNSSQVVNPTKDTEDGATENLSNGGLETPGSVILSTEAQYSETAALPDASTDEKLINVKPDCIVVEAENAIPLTTENKPAEPGLALVGINCSEVENKPVVLSNRSARDLVEDKTPADWVHFNTFSKKEVAGAPLDFFSRTAKSDTSESASTEEAYSHFTPLGNKSICEVSIEENGTCHDALGSPSENALKLQNECYNNGDLCQDKLGTNEFSTERHQIGKESQNESAVYPTSFNLESHEPSSSELLDKADGSLCAARGENQLNLSDDTNDLLTLRLSDRESESKQPPLEHLSNGTEGTMPSGSRSPSESGSHPENGFEDSTDQVSEGTHHQPLGNAEPVNPSASFPLSDNEKPPQDPQNLDEETVEPCTNPLTTQPNTVTEMVPQDISTPEANTLLHLPSQEGENFQKASLSGVEMEPILDLPKPFRYASLPSEKEAIYPQHLQAAALTREDDIPFVGQLIQPHISLATPNDGSEHGLVNLEEEMLDEYGRPNGIRRTKIPRGPRPPDALIEAVASHDKSRLRKVTERALSQLQPKEDERNSLLEQIRNRSFSLKPAAVTRPSVQGPRTNLKLVAILEKANAIRQALAGSDDDDDEDSWSDS